MRAVVAALACLCVARATPDRSLRAYSTPQNQKDITKILISIEERLKVLDTVSAVQMKQARRLDVIQAKLDRVENTLTFKLEKAQFAAERLEHRLHMLQTNVQASIKETADKLEQSQLKIAEIAQNLTGHIIAHKHLLDKVNGAYADTWHRSIIIESLMRDGLSLVNVTRRELADGLRSLRRHRDARVYSADIETILTKKLNDSTTKIDLKMKELMDAQKHFVDSCQQVQQDDPNQLTDILDKLLESLIKIASWTFRELHKIQDSINNHDDKVIKILNATRTSQTETTCRRLETAFRNTSHTILKENELRQLTEKFVSLTDRADAAVQRLEAHIKDNFEEPAQASDVTAVADKLLQKLKDIDNEESDEDSDWEDENNYFEDSGGDDIMEADKEILSSSYRKTKTTTTVRPPHRRHLHKHPYDRGPI